MRDALPVKIGELANAVRKRIVPGDDRSQTLRPRIVQSGKSRGILRVAMVAASASYCPARAQKSMRRARLKVSDSADQVSGDIERVMTNSSVAVISTRCRSVSPSASGPSKILD